jgi:hypothetical protein
MNDLTGQSIHVGDKVAFAVNSFKGYLGIGTVVEILPERENEKVPGTVIPSKLKVRVESSSKATGARPGTFITLGNAFRRAYEPGGNLDTVFVYARG